MIDHSVYKLIHLIGILLVFVALGGASVHALNGGTRASNTWRKPLGATHGIGLFLILLGGFGMMARMGIHLPWPGWIFAKVGIWVLLGGATLAVYRAGDSGRALWLGIPAVGTLAAWLAIFKPF